MENVVHDPWYATSNLILHLRQKIMYTRKTGGHWRVTFLFNTGIVFSSSSSQIRTNFRIDWKQVRIQSEGIFLKRREVPSIRKSYNHHLWEQSCLNQSRCCILKTCTDSTPLQVGCLTWFRHSVREWWMTTPNVPGTMLGKNSLTCLLPHRCFNRLHTTYILPLLWR